MHITQLFVNNHASLLPTLAPLYCRQNQDFLNKLNESPVECSYIKSGYYLHITWKHCQRKNHSIGLISLLLNYIQVENKLNCFGSEFNSCSCYWSGAVVGVYRSRLNSYSYTPGFRLELLLLLLLHGQQQEQEQEQILG